MYGLRLKPLWNEKFIILIMVSLERSLKMTIKHLLPVVPIYRNLRNIEFILICKFATSDVTLHNEFWEVRTQEQETLFDKLGKVANNVLCKV